MLPFPNETIDEILRYVPGQDRANAALGLMHRNNSCKRISEWLITHYPGRLWLELLNRGRRIDSDCRVTVARDLIEHDKTNLYEAFYHMASSGYTEVVRLLIKYYTRASDADKEVFVTKARESDTFHTLLAALNIDINGLTTEQIFPLFIYSAIGNGHVEVCKLFMAIHDCTVDNLNALAVLAASKGHIDAVEFLISKGANVDNFKNQAFFVVTKLLRGREEHPETVRFLLSFGIMDRFIRGALARKIIRGSLDIVRILVENGAVVNANHVALAVKHQRSEIARFLSEHIQYVSGALADGPTPAFLT